MANEKEMKQAQAVYESICSLLEKKEWHFKRHDEDLAITCGVSGDDLPVDILFCVRPEVQVVSVFSAMPYKIAEDKRVDAALAVSVANYGLINGSFDYDLSDGEICFRVVSSYRESILSEDIFDYMLALTVSTVDTYNDKFLMVSTGKMTLQQFVEWEGNKNN